MERNAYRKFDNGTYRVELSAVGDTDSFARHADSILTGVTSTLDSYVLPTVSLAVAAQASQPAPDDSAVTDVDVDSNEPTTVETAPASVRSANPVVEMVKISLHGVDVTLVVVVELNPDLTTDILDLREIVRDSVTSITSVQIAAAIIDAVVLGAAISVPSSLAGLLGSGLGNLLGVHGSHAHFRDSAANAGSSSPYSNSNAREQLLKAFRAAAPARPFNPFDDDLDLGGPGNDFFAEAESMLRCCPPTTSTTRRPRETTTVPTDW